MAHYKVTITFTRRGKFRDEKAMLSWMRFSLHRAARLKIIKCEEINDDDEGQDSSEEVRRVGA